MKLLDLLKEDVFSLYHTSYGWINRFGHFIPTGLHNHLRVVSEHPTTFGFDEDINPLYISKEDVYKRGWVRIGYDSVKEFVELEGQSNFIREVLKRYRIPLNKLFMSNLLDHIELTTTDQDNSIIDNRIKLNQYIDGKTL